MNDFTERSDLKIFTQPSMYFPVLGLPHRNLSEKIQRSEPCSVRKMRAGFGHYFLNKSFPHFSIKRLPFLPAGTIVFEIDDPVARSVSSVGKHVEKLTPSARDLLP